MSQFDLQTKSKNISKPNLIHFKMNQI